MLYLCTTNLVLGCQESLIGILVVNHKARIRQWSCVKIPLELISASSD